ncbi:MAG: hypothetical protein ACLPYS_17730 [Vulcanimicrobiaceae bacterium]
MTSSTERRVVTPFKRSSESESAFLSEPDDWRPGRVSQEERIAAVLIVVLLSMLVATGCFTYFLNRENTRAAGNARIVTVGERTSTP